jgi:hypothetical protein
LLILSTDHSFYIQRGRHAIHVVFFLLSVRHGMDTKRKLQDQDIAQGLILDSDSNKQLSEEDISPSDINTDSNKRDTVQTGSTQNGLAVLTLNLLQL